MPASVEIINQQELLRELNELSRRHRAATRALLSDGHSPVINRVMAFASSEFADVWEETSPRLYGVLAGATRSQVYQGVGQVFIDPSVVHPVLGGRPSIYGPIVHERNPWVDRLVRTDSPRILSETGEMLFHELDGIYPNDDLTGVANV